MRSIRKYTPPSENTKNPINSPLRSIQKHTPIGEYEKYGQFPIGRRINRIFRIFPGGCVSKSPAHPGLSMSHTHDCLSNLSDFSYSPMGVCISKSYPFLI